MQLPSTIETPYNWASWEHKTIIVLVYQELNNGRDAATISRRLTLYFNYIASWTNYSPIQQYITKVPAIMQVVIIMSATEILLCVSVTTKWIIHSPPLVSDMIWRCWLHYTWKVHSLTNPERTMPWISDDCCRVCFTSGGNSVGSWIQYKVICYCYLN